MNKQVQCNTKKMKQERQSKKQSKHFNILIKTNYPGIKCNDLEVMT